MKPLYDQIWESALRKLEIRSHSRFELKQKLTEKFPDERGEILKVLEEMERVQLLNDRRFTEEFIHHIIQKPVGRFKIGMEAKRRGLDADYVDQVLENAGWNETEAAKQALSRKDSVLNEKDERKRKQKLMNFLRNRGFRDAVIFQVVK